MECPRQRGFGGDGLIPQREIIAWRAVAPWPSDVQVQDLLITRCVAAIFSDEFLRDNLAMRGGTALHKVHLAPATRFRRILTLSDIISGGECLQTRRLILYWMAGG
jgi:hypothetical protein